MNELNLQNPHFIQHIISMNVNNYRTLINFVNDKKSYYLISRNNFIDNHQVWQPLGMQRDLTSFSDLKTFLDECPT